MIKAVNMTANQSEITGMNSLSFIILAKSNV